eukprot:30916-Pelagococcus_subviridis.AAC.14
MCGRGEDLSDISSTSKYRAFETLGPLACSATPSRPALGRYHEQSKTLTSSRSVFEASHAGVTTVFTRASRYAFTFDASDSGEKQEAIVRREGRAR